MSLKIEQGALLHRQGSGKQTCLRKQSEALCYTIRVEESKHVSQNRARLSVTPPGFSKANVSLKTERGSLLHCQGSAKQTRLSKQSEALCYTARIRQSKHVFQSRGRLSATPLELCNDKYVSQNRGRFSVTPPGFSKANNPLKTERGSLLHHRVQQSKHISQNRASLSSQ